MVCARKPALSPKKTAFTEIYMKKRTDKNSATAAVTGFAGVTDDAILPPVGVCPARLTKRSINERW